MAIGALTFVSHMFMGTWIWDLHTASHDSLEVVRISLTVIGGIGAVGYLVIKYQERQANSREEHRTITQTQHRAFTEAIDMMGSDYTANRIAGIHALASAGTQDHELQPTIIDILCGYLRTTRPTDDAPVESTIIHRLHDVLRKDNPDRWQHIDIDVHGATITAPFELTNVVIANADFSHATFNGLVTLDYVEFENYALFENTIFKESVAIRHATFQDGADFTQSEFHNAIDFLDTEFMSPHTELVMKDGFQLPVAFQNAVYFRAAHFHGVASFGDTHFITDCVFSELRRRQPGGKYESLPTTFEWACFTRTKFFSSGGFDGVEFARAPLVEDVEFHDSGDEAQFNKLVAASKSNRGRIATGGYSPASSA